MRQALRLRLVFVPSFHACFFTSPSTIVCSNSFFWFPLFYCIIAFSFSIVLKTLVRARASAVRPPIPPVHGAGMSKGGSPGTAEVDDNISAVAAGMGAAASHVSTGSSGSSGSSSAAGGGSSSLSLAALPPSPSGSGSGSGGGGGTLAGPAAMAAMVVVDLSTVSRCGLGLIDDVTGSEQNEIAAR